MSEQKSSLHHSSVLLERISEHADGQRVDNYLLNRLKGVPKSKIYQIIRKGEVRLDKKRVKPSSRVHEGQTLRIPPIRMDEKGESEGHLKLDKHQAQIASISSAILYEDDYLLVINKPAGLAVHGGSGISLGLIELLRASRPEASFLELVHRLDRETSGCMVIAKKGSVLRELHRLIREGELEKHYQALLSGRWKGASHLIEAPLKKNTLQSGERVVRVSREGKESKTLFKVLERFSDATLVDALLLTGRTHQIRVHTQYAGYPIIGDEKYGYPEVNQRYKTLGFTRMFLHAYSLSLPLSVYESPLEIIAPLENEFERCLQMLRSAND